VKELYKLENGKWVAPVPVEMAVLTSRFVSQALLFGRNKQFNVLLLVPNAEALKKQLNTQALDVNDPKLVTLVVEDVQHALKMANIKKFEAPQRCHLIAEEFSVENGLLTNKLSMKRNIILKKYDAELEAMYDGTGGHPIALYKGGKEPIDE
jgi:long-chain acyl-CoA synthetase